jgi:hypothetical protein
LPSSFLPEGRAKAGTIPTPTNGLETVAGTLAAYRRVKHRLHVDVAVDDLEGAADRLESLGGRRIEAPIEVGNDVRVVAEGNGFGPVTQHSEDGG